ncbi:MAG TPA: amino acid adenylation domain-containing protein, partial [Longimicrobiaceae bacterium]|nr:amino acid adenylation domain-containing protein [Longimicrobiaceae bacterium]
MAAGDGRRVEGLELLSPAERRQVVEEWNRTDGPYPAGACIHELFEAQAERSPDATAVVQDDRALAYSELNARANRLAHHLRRLGVGPEARVALCVERSPEMVVGLLAVLKAGGAYVPLDPTHPDDRLRFVLADSAPAVLLTQPSLAGRFADLGLPVLALGEAESGWADGPDTNPERAGPGPESLAYVIYTSGSPGRSKGVMVEHHSVCRQVAAIGAVLQLTPADRSLQFASVTFDASVEEIFAALLSGSTLVLRTDAWIEDAAAFWARCEAHGVTVMDLPTRFWQLLASDAGRAIPSRVRLVAVGGEAADPSAVAAWFRGGGHRPRLVNTYGPTECTVNATTGAWTGDPSTWRSIGRPVRNTRAYLLDPRGEPVPVGVAGEIHLAGGQVARGYLGRPELTAERFVPDPFSAEPGARLYRTGDLGRWLPDGSIRFLGRNDFQLKVRGFRIEPGEVEARLSEHPGVREAAVLAREDASGERRLVAYYAGTAEADALRAHLSAQLPDYMVPAAYVRLGGLPLTPSGKLDRAALPAPGGDPRAGGPSEPPRGATEAAVAEIWAELLGLERVGRWDHFFELGGHSLRAIQVVSRVRQVLGVDAAVGDLFARPVLADFARGLGSLAPADLPAIEPADRSGPLALSFAQQRLWLLDRMGGTGTAYHLPMHVRLRGALDRAALEGALDRIVARHEALRTTFAAADDGRPVQRIAPPEESAFRLADHDLRGHADAAAELRRLVAGEARAPFDLERGPLVRGRLARLADDDHVLLLTMHHVVSDGWSVGVLLEELSVLYGALLRGEADPLPPLAVQYADYAAWQRRWVTGEVLQRQADYWKQALAGAPELLELPADHARPARQDHAGATVRVELDEELTAGLRALGERHGTTLFMTLLAGWAAVLSRLSGQRDVVVGTPTANRGRREIEGLIGFFV